MARRKFNLGDILRKLNEEQAPASGGTRDEATAPPPRPASDHESSVGSAPLTTERAGDDPLPGQPSFAPGRHQAGSPPQTRPAIPHPASSTVAPEPVHAPEPSATTTTTELPATELIAPASEPKQQQADISPLASRQLPDEEDEESEFDLFRYIAIILRRKTVILAVAALVAMFSAFQYLRAERFYTVRARLLFRPDDQELMGDARVYRYWRDQEKMFTTHLELLRSQTVLTKVADNLGGRISAGAISGGLVIRQGETNGEKNDIIELSFKHPDAELAKESINELCQTYIDYRREVNSQEITRLVYRLETQIDKLQTELDQKESDLRRFKEDNRLVQLSSETNLTVQKLADMELALQQTQLALVESKERLTALNSQIGRQELNVVQSMTYENPFKNRIADLELELNTLSAENSPEHFKIKTLRQQIENLKQATIDSVSREAASKTLVKNPIRQALIQVLVNLTIEQSALETKRTAQEQLIELLNRDLLKLPSMEQKYAYLQRETESLLQTLRMLKSRLEETKIRRDSQDSDLKVLELAQTPRVAVSDVKMSSIWIGLFVGLVLGIALAFLLEYLDQSLKEPGDVERVLELPLLGIVPFIEAEKAMVENTADLAKNILEPFRALRANLKHIAAAHEIKTYIVCSAVKGEGKTTLAANLAITFSLDGRRVILVDGDLRRSQMHTLFGVPKEHGFADYLTGTATLDDIMKPTRYENLFVITSGNRPHNPAELLGTVRFETMLQEIRTRGDVVIFDSPALLPVSDTLTMAPKMDCAIMVVRTLWTPLKAAKQAKTQLTRIGSKMFGGILNGVAHSRGYYPYYYGYYGYYSYAYRYGYDDAPRKLSIRELGLRLESKIREGLRGMRYSMPRYIAGAGSLARSLARKKRFWLLLLTLAGLVGLRIRLQSRPVQVGDDAIQYLGVGSAAPDMEPARPLEAQRPAEPVVLTPEQVPDSLDAPADSLRAPADNPEGRTAVPDEKSDTTPIAADSVFSVQ